MIDTKTKQELINEAYKLLNDGLPISIVSNLTGLKEHDLLHLVNSNS